MLQFRRDAGYAYGVYLEVEIIVDVLPAVIPLIAEVFRIAIKRKKLKLNLQTLRQKIVIQGQMSYDQVQSLINNTFGVVLDRYNVFRAWYWYRCL
jgi:hypothetical protein